MNKKSLLSVLFIFVCCFVKAGNSMLSLDGFWKFKTDPYKIGHHSQWYSLDYNVAEWDSLYVPGNWDLRNEYAHYVGLGWYYRTFDAPDIGDQEAFIRFEAVNINYEVWLNGSLLGSVEGGYFPQEWNVTKLLRKGNNTLAVCVDNSFRSGAYWSWGGIRRHVDLCIRPKDRIENIKILAEPDLKKGTSTIRITSTVTCSETSSITYSVMKNGKVLASKSVTSNVSSIDMTLSKAQTRLWSFDSPELYQLKAEMKKNGKVTDAVNKRFGIRRISHDSKSFYLNGEPVRLLGLNWVADDRLTGNTLPPSVFKRHIDDMRKMGAVMARLSHLPLPEEVLDYLDEVGMMVIDEIPVWGITPLATPDNPLAFTWLKQMVNCHFNHPCVVAWSVGNEIGNQVGNPKVTPYVKKAIDYVKTMDTSRPAIDVSCTSHANKVNDPSQYSDFYALNTYGAHFGAHAEQVLKNYGEKPLFMTEYGSCLKGEDLETGFGSEAAAVRDMRGRDFLFGASLWTYNDYRSMHYSPTPTWKTSISENRSWGLVDDYGRHKRAYDEARKEYAPLKSWNVSLADGKCAVTLIPREKYDLPAYILRNYSLRLYSVDIAGDNHSMANVKLPEIHPGSGAVVREIKMSNHNTVAYRLALCNAMGIELMDTLLVNDKPAKPTINSVITASSMVRVYFNLDNLGSRYYVKCTKQSSGETIISDTVGYSNFIDVAKLTRDEQYQVRLYATNSQGATESDPIVIRVKGNSMLPPEIKQIQGFPESKSIGIGYSSIDNEYLYEVEYAKNLEMTKDVKRLYITTRGACTIPNLEQGTYYVRIRSYQQYQQVSEWSPIVCVSLAGTVLADAGLDFTKMIPKKPVKHIFQMDGYCVWCNGAIKGDDGKYHLFFSRWPESRGYDAWCTHSEIAHAVSDSLLGPYVFHDIAIPHRGNKYWDGDYAHNPHVLKDGGTYYLYYTGNRGSGYWYNTADSVKPTPNDHEWWINRNNQRVGVAISKSPYGPWKRFDNPLIDISKGRKTTGVPTVSKRADGKYMMVYKSVIDNGTFKGGGVVHHVALADSPLGPFVDYEKPFVVSSKCDFPIDDHVEWYQDGKYYCIAKDHAESVENALTEYGKALILFESEDGLDWHLSRNVLVHPFNIVFSDGERMEFDRLEMPKVYLEGGKVKALFLAAKKKNDPKSFSIVLPVN